MLTSKEQQFEFVIGIKKILIRYIFYKSKFQKKVNILYISCFITLYLGDNIQYSKIICFVYMLVPRYDLDLSSHRDISWECCHYKLRKNSRRLEF